MRATGRDRGAALVVVLLTGVAAVALLATTLQWAAVDLRVSRLAGHRVWLDAVARASVDVATAMIEAEVATTGRPPPAPPALDVRNDVDVGWSVYEVGLDGTVDFEVEVTWDGWTSVAGGRWPRGR